MTQNAVRRPRVAAIGLDEAQRAAIDHLCGTLRTADSVPHYLQRHSWSETDITVVATNDGIAGYGTAGHLLTIGTPIHQWTGHGIWGQISPRAVGLNSNNTEHELSVPGTCPERYRHLASDLARQLGCLEGAPSTFAVEHEENDRTLVKTTSGHPVALRCLLLPRAPEPEPAVALAIPEEADLAAWFRAFLADVHELDPARVPQPPPRLTNPSNWYTPEERSLAQQIATIQKNIDQLQQERLNLEAQLTAASEHADADKRRCLWADGDDLVDAVENILKEVGFSVRNMDAEIQPGEPKREDLRLTIASRDGWEAIAEVKGYAAGSRTSDTRQIREYRDRYIKEEGNEPDMTLWIANTHKSVEDPSARPRPSNDVEQRSDIIDAVHVLAADLYRLWVLVQEGRLEQSQAIQHLIDTPPGLWLPPILEDGLND